MNQYFDPILLEVMWNRLISIVNEQATALISGSFTTVVRETEDLAAGLFTADAKMVAQSETGTPGHINTMAIAVQHFAKKFKDNIKPGDVLIGNDPWLCSGHRNDITSVTPLFKGDVLVGWSATCCHAIDIGGPGFTADTKDVFEEGLGIPFVKLFKEGEINQDIVDIITTNVRMPTEVMGDIMAQVSSQDISGDKLCDFMDQYELDSIEPLANAIFDRSEKAMRKVIGSLPDGEYSHELLLDGFDEMLKMVATVIIDGNNLTVDYAGTSHQINWGVNVPFNYTVAYTTYPIKTLISPDVPNNEGSFRPVTVKAPKGCFLNATFPYPVMGRHLTGHFCPAVINGAFEDIVAERTTGDGGGLWIPQWYCRTNEGQRFTSNYFCNGGMGARYSKDGIHAFTYPSNCKNSPAEVLESEAPIFFEKKEIICDSGGIGKYRGGCGQTVVFSLTNSYPAVVSCLFERIKYPALGRKGGGDGSLGEIIIRDMDGNDRRPKAKTKPALNPGDKLILNLPGGGGFGNVLERDPDAVLEDVVQGYVSIESAKNDYKIVIRETDKGFEIDQDATKRLRS